MTHDRHATGAAVPPGAEAAEQEAATFSDLTRHVVRNGVAIFTRERASFLSLLQSFLGANNDPASSPNLQSPEPDRIETVLKLLNEPSLDADEELCHCLLQVIKVLSRKQVNRSRVGQIGIRSVLSRLEGGPALPMSARVAAEGANVLLNICYEREHVISLLRCDGVPPLIGFLGHEDEAVAANAAGAIQAICFQDKGRVCVREQGAVAKLVPLLASNSSRVARRAVGALHNLSSDPECLSIIRKRGGIPSLVELLRADHLATCGSAAGTLQNISREAASRHAVRDEEDAVPALADLLSAQDLSAQVCAAGALLNVLGPELDKSSTGEVGRRAFGSILSCALALSMMYDCVWEDTPALLLDYS